MMPSIGKAEKKGSNRFAGIQMKKQDAQPENVKSGKPDFSKMTGKEKEKFFHNLTGFKKKTIFKDGKKHNIMGKDGFMKLFTAQLKNQDPTKPMDQNKMTSELAQFSQLEQLTALNKKFDDMNKTASLENKFFGASFLGKEVISRGNTVRLEEAGTQADLFFSLDQPAKRASIQVLDSKGNILRQYMKEDMGRGNHQLIWDGEQTDGAPSPAGDYQIRVAAWDKGNELISTDVMNKGTVTSVHMENGQPVLMVNGKKVALRDVHSFKMQKPENERPSQKMPVARSGMDEIRLRQAAMKNKAAQSKVGTYSEK